MEFGVTMFVTDYSIGAAEFAVAVEERGFDALFVPDHTHIPAARDTPFSSGGELPSDYIRNLDMFSTLTAAATVTKRIRLGTGICLVVERDPIVTAKPGLAGHRGDPPPQIRRFPKILVKHV